MKTLGVVVSLMVCSVFCKTVLAQEQKVEHKVQDSGWSIGGGIGFGTWAIPYLNNYPSGSMGFSFTPIVGVLVERRLCRNLNLLLDMGGGYGRSSSDNRYAEPGNFTGDSASESYGAKLTLGLRHIFNPDGPVEVSGIVFVGGIYRGHENYRTSLSANYAPGEEPATIEYEDIEKTLSLGGGFGVAFERKLMDNLFLRFESSLVQAYWGKSREINQTREENLIVVDYDDTRTNFNIGLAFTPMIQLRLLI